jgi:Kef-type K+ transport system membrane component KefB
VIVGQSGFGLSEALVGQGLHFDILLNATYWMGLIALMFITGAGLPRESDDKIAPAITVLVGGTLIALIVAFATAGLISGRRYDEAIGHTAQSVLAYQMILAIAAVVTSVPFLSKIFQNVGMLNTYFAKRILASACILDLILWNLVPIAEVTRNSSSLSVASAVKSIVLAASFSILIIYYGPRLCRIVIEAGKSSVWRTVAVVVAFCAAVVGLGILFGVHPMIAAVLAGYCVGHTRAPIREEFSAIEKFGTNNMVPMYFAIVGMSVHIVRDFNLGLILSFIIWSSVIKIACVFIATKLYFGDTAKSMHYAVTMNTRGGPGIALAALALSLGLIGQPTFLALVFASFVTAAVTEAWLMVFYRRSLVSVPSTNNPPAW